MADILIKEWDIGAMRRGASNAPSASRILGTNFPWDALNFDEDSDEYVYLFGSIPGSDLYAAGQDVKIEFEWVSDGSATGVVRWQASIVGRADGEAWDVAYTDTNTVDDARIAANSFHLASVTLSSPSLSPNDAFILRISRNSSHGNDGYGADADLVRVRLYAVE